MITYSDKLKDPRWQRKRLEVLSAADFKCEFCGAADKTLHVHHLKYTGEPWEAPKEDLEALCEACHHTRETGALFEIHFTTGRASQIKKIKTLFYQAVDQYSENPAIREAVIEFFSLIASNGPEAAILALRGHGK